MAFSSRALTSVARPLLASLIFFELSVPSNRACTLWGAVGEAAATQGSLVSKNRDWVPDHVQRLKIVRPTNGHRYLGLYAEGGADPGLKAGINDQGLAVITATAGSIPNTTREAQPETPGILKKLLTNFASIDEVLTKREIFSTAHAEFLVLSDRTKIAVVEVGLDGKYAIKLQENGTVAHTNHYCQAPLTTLNETVSESSDVRFKRIQELLSGQKPPYTLASFKQMSTDQNAGPNNSIWRTGSSPQKNRTLATWITETPLGGPPKIYVKLANPDTQPREYNYILDESFWNSPLPD